MYISRICSSTCSGLYRYKIDFSAEDNEFLLNWKNDNQLRVYFRAAYYMSTSKAENDAHLLGWNKHCMTWRVNGQFKVCLQLFYTIQFTMTYCVYLFRPFG